MKLSTLLITSIATLALTDVASALPKLTAGNSKMEAGGACVECAKRC